MSEVGSTREEAQSNPGSAKSKASNKKSPKSSKPASGAQSAKSKGSGRKENASKKPLTPKKPEASVEPSEAEERPLPDGCIPIFLSGATQKLFSLIVDQDVTKSSPFKIIPKADIIADMKQRAAVSDFSPQKQIINNYEGTEILLMYDAEFRYGENFVLASTEEAKDALLNPPEPTEPGEGDTIIEEEQVFHYVPPESKPWVSLGSEVEINEEHVIETRPRIQMVFERVRSEFGAPVTFSDRNAGDVKDGCIEVTAYEDKSFGVRIMEMDKSVHNAPEQITSGSQTEWKYPVNAFTQYEPRDMPQEEKDKILESDEMKTNMENTLPLFVTALQHNEIMNFFYDDYKNLAAGDDTFDNRADNTLKEFQSFTDLKMSKDKAVTHVVWHPTLKGVIAMSVAEKMTFDQRIDQSAKVVMSPSLIIIWSFADPIQPQLLLEAPDDIYCFAFCPSDPHIVAGGCINGQVVLWDIEKHMDDLKNIKSKLKAKNTMPYLADFDDEDADKVPVMRFCAASSIEHSHVAPITDLQWVPDHFEVNQMGYPLEAKQLKNILLMTCGVDHVVNFWDITHNKASNISDKNKDSVTPMGVPETFKHLDLKWKPYLKVHLFKSEPGGDHSPTKFTIREIQGDRRVLELSAEEKEKEGAYGAPGGKGGTGRQRTLQNVKTYIYVGTEDGELVYVDWMPQKDQDTGKVQTTKPEFYSSIHDGAISSLERSPFDRSLILVVGGWMWSIWKEGINSGPILASCPAHKPLTGGIWSPTRPAVFYIIRADGVVEVWDLLDKTHESSLTQALSSVSLTCIQPYNLSKQQLLAVGDTNGTLHVFQVPWRLRSPTPNETTNLNIYIDREVRRRAFVIKRWNFREQEKIEKEQEAKRKAGIAPQVTLTEEEIIQRMKIEYDQFLEEEQAFLRELGLKDDDDMPAGEQGAS